MGDPKGKGSGKGKVLRRYQQVVVDKVDFEKRIIWVTGDIDEAALLRLQVAAVMMADDSDQPIFVGINSTGGEVGAGIGMYDVLCELKAPVHTVGCGQVMSIAVLVLQAGDSRALYPNTRLLLHEGSTTMCGDIHSSIVVATGKEQEQLNALFVHLLSERSGQDAGAIRELCRDETYLGAHEAVRLGLADVVYTKKSRPSNE